MNLEVINIYDKCSHNKRSARETGRMRKEDGPEKFNTQKQIQKTEEIVRGKKKPEENGIPKAKRRRDSRQAQLLTVLSK